jgi:glyoxylase-like metal-dependent hydrolase (beta-lactamase superfamily II)
MKITTNIFQVGGSGISHPADAAAYLIIDGDEAALVDAGTGRGHDKLVKNIGKYADPDKIKILFLTHCHYDHTGGANGIRNITGCKIAAHTLDADFLEMGDSDVTAASWYGCDMETVRIDIKVDSDRKQFRVGGLDVDFIHAPGHSPGSAVLTAISDGKLVLFGQDVHGPLNDMLRSSRTDYIKSLEMLVSLDADILCEGHFGVTVGKQKVKKFIVSFL